MHDKSTKKKNDLEARSQFKALLKNTWSEFLNEELRILSPDAIIVLGNEAFNVGQSVLNQYSDKIVKIRHPSNGGAKIAREQIQHFIKNNTICF